MIVFLLLVVIVLLCEISCNIKALNNNIIEFIKLFNRRAQKRRRVMIVVKERKAVPHTDVRCGNCGSLLQYGNADLHVDNQRHNVRYYFDCPVCGCKVNANWIIKEEGKVRPNK